MLVLLFYIIFVFTACDDDPDQVVFDNTRGPKAAKRAVKDGIYTHARIQNARFNVGYVGSGSDSSSGSLTPSGSDGGFNIDSLKRAILESLKSVDTQSLYRAPSRVSPPARTQEPRRIHVDLSADPLHAFDTDPISIVPKDKKPPIIPSEDNLSVAPDVVDYEVEFCVFSGLHVFVLGSLLVILVVSLCITHPYIIS